MAPPGDLREWIRLLEDEGELVRVAAEVDPDLEITEIVDRTVKSGGPALLFEQPKGARPPLLINPFGTERPSGRGGAAKDVGGSRAAPCVGLSLNTATLRAGPGQSPSCASVQ